MSSSGSGIPCRPMDRLEEQTSDLSHLRGGDPVATVVAEHVARVLDRALQRDLRFDGGALSRVASSPAATLLLLDALGFQRVLKPRVRANLKIQGCALLRTVVRLLGGQDRRVRQRDAVGSLECESPVVTDA